MTIQSREIRRKDFPFRESMMFVTSGLLLGAMIPLLNYLFIWDERSVKRLALFSIISIVSIAFALPIIFSKSFIDIRKKWLRINLISFLCLASGIFLQGYLLAQLTHPYALSRMARVISQYGLVFTALGLVYWLYGLPKKDRYLWTLVCITMAGLFAFQWIVLPLRYWPVKHYIAAWAPLIILGMPLLFEGLTIISRRLERASPGRLHVIGWISLGIILVISGILFYRAALDHAQRMNTTTAYGDQVFYLSIAKEARRLNFHYTGNQNQMPLFPFLLALFYKPEMTDQVFFESGKQINIILTLIFLLFMFLIYLRYFKPFQALIMLLIVAFSLFIFKAPYFQVENTYYFFSFLSFLLMLKMLVEPKWHLAVAAGILAGLAHLSKASILPGFFLFIGIYLCKETVSWLQQKTGHAPPPLGLGRRLVLLFVVLISFVIVTLPYGRSMQKRFGNYFYNVNTAVYLWYDNWIEAREAEKIFHFQDRPVDLPVAERPGLQKYLREHRAKQILERIRYGIDMQITNIIYPYSVTSYPINYLWILLLVILVDVKNSIRLVKQNFYVVLFVLLFFAGYLLAFSWYSVIIASPRFLHSLFAPLLFSIFYAINTLAQNRPSDEAEKDSRIDLVKYFNAVNVAMAMTLFYNVWLVCSERLFHTVYYT